VDSEIWWGSVEYFKYFDYKLLTIAETGKYINIMELK
jgi:hypothetical protein